MSSKSKTIIRISRDKNIEDSRANAILALNDFQNVVGQLVMVRYRRSEDTPDTESIDTIVAIGTDNGTGPSTYRIIFSGSSKACIWGVYDVPGQYPDVASLAHGEIYLVKNTEDKWCYCYAVNNIRQVVPIVGGPYKYLDLTDNFLWYYDPITGLVNKEGSYMNSEDLTVILNDLTDRLTATENTVNNLDLKIFPFTCTATFSATSPSIQYVNTVPNTVTATLNGKKESSSGGSPIDVTSNTTFQYRVGTGSWTNLPANPYTMNPGAHDYGSVIYSFRGTNTNYGNYGLNVSAGSFVFNYGMAYLTGVVGNSWEPTSLSGLNMNGPYMQSTSYSKTYTTSNLSQYPVFALPSSFGNVTKVTDQNGYDVTNGWTDYDHQTFSYALNGKTYQYRVWKKVDGAIATNFKYTFTIG